MSSLWTASSLQSACGGRAVGEMPEAVTGVSIDSRTVSPGEVFFAIRGDRFDGHDYVGAALAQGAALAVVSEEKVESVSAAPGPLLVVRDVLDALVGLGRAARARSQARIIGVTGSVGKTGTKEALRLALARSGATHASAASYNNHWGVPLSLARMPEDARFGVFEMGMNAPGEISALTRMVRPHVAIVTTVEPVHLEFFGTVEKIADAKGEIFEGLEPGGIALVNRDNPMCDRLSERAVALGARIVTFGEREGADVRLKRLVLHAHCSCVVADVLGDEVTYKLGAPGRHLALNSLAVLGAAKLAGADLALAALSLNEMRAPKGRGERFVLTVDEGTLTVIDESYNANPASMRAALALLKQAEPEGGGRRIAVLGDMLELGEASAGLHRELAAPLDQAGVDLVFASGPQMRTLWEELAAGRKGHYAESSDGLTAPLLGEVRAGDVIMIKGSLGSRMGPIVEALKARFALTDAEATGEPA